MKGVLNLTERWLRIYLDQYSHASFQIFDSAIITDKGYL